MLFSTVDNQGKKKYNITAKDLIPGKVYECNAGEFICMLIAHFDKYVVFVFPNKYCDAHMLDLDDLVALCKNDCMFAELHNAKLTLEYGK